MRHLYFSLVSTIILVLATSSCSTGIPENSKNIKNQVVINQQSQKDTPNDTVPVWFSSGQPNTDQLLYGFGAAKSLEKATQKALADMVQKLQVTVSTTTNFTNVTTNDKVSQKLTQQITTTTTQITIPNYKVINQSELNQIFYVEVQTNKEQTINDLKELINSNINQAQQLLTTTNNKSSLYRFAIAQQVTKNIQLINSSLRTLIILVPDSNINSQIEILNQIDNELLNLKRGLQIYVDKQNSGFFYNSLEKFLQVNKYNITNKKDLANINITLKLKDYDNKFNSNEYCIETKVELQALDDSTNQLSPKQYTIKVCSKQGRLAAIDKAVEIFYSQLNDAESIY
ncbi:hypothetical protein B4919_07120 [Francisella tularensis subsp. novicida]|uniref:LPP20 family lipoprotein n=1 Tax=Francisella tularensis TaxID=263 RepID=UPI000CE2ABB5|nr:LPP20 family lipoprotein [Francisella tularensis]AVC44565.1 hypothetical protein B4919_07120 [Francisella tularensis subsp. novicida]